MTKKELIQDVKKLLPEVFGENFTLSENKENNTTEWNFTDHLVSLIFIGNKYEVKVDSTALCGNIDRFTASEMKQRIWKVIYPKPLEFLEDKLGTINISKMIQDGELNKFRLEYDDTTGVCGFAIHFKDGRRLVSVGDDYKIMDTSNNIIKTGKIYEY